MEPNIFEQVDFSKIQHHHHWTKILGQAKLRVLFVTDGRFNDTNSVYEYMNGKTLGCTKISVKRAMYSYSGDNVTINATPNSNEPHFNNFKFNSSKPDGGSILDDFDVMYIFAVNSNSPSSFNDNELSALHEWMNAGHGVFATGDHSSLGQKMCSHIPRVGTMRKWTDADEVPPGGGETRIDTSQPDPSNAGQLNGSVNLPGSAEFDAHPQKITLVPVRTMRISSTREIQYPHEILCHPTYGAINVMPDHAHEGECIRPSEIELDENVKFTTTVSDTDEYPNVGGNRERPRIIATGKSSHQYMLASGPVNPHTFDMISVYDGYKANVGRVVVDSTWHHWYGMNIDGLQSAGGENWEKIGRYFLNIAKYLAPKGLYKNRCTLDIIDAQFDYPFIEEYVWDKGPKNIYDIGASLRESLTLRWGSCGVLRFVLENICTTRPRICELLEREFILDLDPFDPVNPRDPSPVCLSCPPPDLLINYVLGGIAQQTSEVRESLKRRFSGEPDKTKSLNVKELDQQIERGVEVGIDSFLEKLKGDMKRTEKLWLEK